MAEYVLNPTRAQESIVARLKAAYPHVPVIEDGFLDQDDTQILKFPDGSIKPFVIPRFSSPKRERRGRSFVTRKLDAHSGAVDIVVVARKGSEARKLLNNIGNTLIDWKPVNAGGIFKGEAQWEPSIVSIDAQHRPNRWSASDRFHFGLQADNHTT